MFCKQLAGLIYCYKVCSTASPSYSVIPIFTLAKYQRLFINLIAANWLRESFYCTAVQLKLKANRISHASRVRWPVIAAPCLQKCFAKSVTKGIPLPSLLRNLNLYSTQIAVLIESLPMQRDVMTRAVQVSAKTFTFQSKLSNEKKQSWNVSRLSMYADKRRRRRKAEKTFADLKLKLKSPICG